MIIEHSISGIRNALDNVRGKGIRIGLVPTMGALHAGHTALIREARRACDFVIVTIFVNPTQFGPNEDLDRYPRTLESDAELCRAESVDFIFAPDATEMYPGKQFIRFETETLTDELCGAFRPGHFQGVLQVVNKLFQITQPTDAWFGQKDIQQLVLIQTMVREFNIPVTIHGGQTIREHDGLALSSRNRYLSDEDRGKAPELYRTLQSVVITATEGAPFDPDTLEFSVQQPVAALQGFSGSQDGPASGHTQHTIQESGALSVAGPHQDGEMDICCDADTLAVLLLEARNRLKAKGFKIDYLTIVDFRTLQSQEVVIKNKAYIAAAAVWLGTTRLIDNIIFQNSNYSSQL